MLNYWCIYEARPPRRFYTAPTVSLAVRLPTALRLPLAATALSLAACVSAPEPTRSRVDASSAGEPNLEVLRRPRWATVLQWSDRRAAPVVASTTIGARGGALEIPQTGLVLTVPAGAVSQPTRFSVRALPGSIVAYEFEPHGTRFAKPLVLDQSLRGVARGDVGPEGVALEGGYFADDSQLDGEGGVAQIDEFLPARLSPDGAHVRVEIQHFSGYVLSSGRR